MYNPKKVLSYNKDNAIRNVFTYAPDKWDIIIDVIETPTRPIRLLSWECSHRRALHDPSKSQLNVTHQGARDCTISVTGTHICPLMLPSKVQILTGYAVIMSVLHINMTVHMTVDSTISSTVRDTSLSSPRY